MACGATNFRVKGLITAKLAWAADNITDSLKGPFTKVVKDRWVEVDFTPLYYDPSDTTTLLFPWISQAATPLGTQMFTSSDDPWSIVGQNGDTIVLSAAAVVKMPDLNLAADKDIMGPCQIIGINATGSDPSSATSFYTISTGNSFTYPAVPSTATLARQKWSAAMSSGATGFTAFQSFTGFQITHELGINWDACRDSGQRIGALFTGYRTMAKCQPSANTMAQLNTAMLFSGTGASQGQRYDTNSKMKDLVISGATSATVTVKNATIETGQINFAAEQLRQGEVGFISNIEDSSGAPVDSLVLA